MHSSGQGGVSAATAVKNETKNKNFKEGCICVTFPLPVARSKNIYKEKIMPCFIFTTYCPTALIWRAGPLTGQERSSSSLT